MDFNSWILKLFLNPISSDFVKPRRGQTLRVYNCYQLYVLMNLGFSNASALNDWQTDLLRIALCGAFPWTASLLPALYLQKNEVMTWWIRSSQFVLRSFQILLGRPQRKWRMSWSSPSETRLPKAKQTKESKSGGEWAVTEKVTTAYASDPIPLAPGHQYLPVCSLVRHYTFCILWGGPTLGVSKCLTQEHLLQSSLQGSGNQCFLWKVRFREIKSHLNLIWGCQKWDLNPDRLTPDQTLYCNVRIVSVKDS